jgi:hypothetical protein
MVRRFVFLAATVAVVLSTGCATIAGGLIGTGFGLVTGNPVSGWLSGSGIGMTIDVNR